MKKKNDDFLTIYHCPLCGADMTEDDDHLLFCPKCHMVMSVNDWESGVEYVTDDSLNYEEDIPEGCLACGGPYPSCKIGCNMFED